MPQEGEGIYDFSRVTVAESLSMGVNEGNHYVLGGSFFIHRGYFLYTGIAQWRHRVTEVLKAVLGHGSQPFQR